MDSMHDPRAVDERGRITAAEALQHPYFTQGPAPQPIPQGGPVPQQAFNYPHGMFLVLTLSSVPLPVFPSTTPSLARPEARSSMK